MRNALHKTVDIICVLLEVAFAIISLPFKAIKAVLDIVSIVKRKAA